MKSIRRNPLWTSARTLLFIGAIAVTQLADRALGEDSAVPVAAAKVDREDLYQVQALDAEFRPYQEIDLHAKVAGYVQQITVDIGDRVKAGQLIAKLEVPELDVDLEHAMEAEKLAEEEVNQAKAELQRAEAAYYDAHLSFTRLSSTHKAQPTLVAQQDLDAADAKDRSTQAQVASARVAIATAQLRVAEAKSNIKKFVTMINYASITAPFDGVVTKRYADLGALIQTGTSSSTQTMPLVQLSENGRLRLVFHANESFAAGVLPGVPVEYTVTALGQTYTGVVARISRKLDTSTRTMDAEVDVPNPKLELTPGMFATVKLKINPHAKALAVPVEAVSRKSKSTVYLINGKNEIEERTVTLGLETPTKIEVLSGLHENDLVMIGSRTQIRPGQKVEPKLVGNTSLTE